MTKNGAPSTAGSSSHQRTRGTATPAAAAARSKRNSWRRLVSITCPGGSRRRTSRSVAPSGVVIVNSQVSRDARPGRFQAVSRRAWQPQFRALHHDAMAELSAEDRVAIGELLASYCYAIDLGRWETLPQLFTDDCRLDFGAT